MLCFMASPTNWFADCSQFRTPPPGWLILRALGGLIISRLFSASCTGFRCGSASCWIKVATLVDQSLSGHAPGYLVDDCQLVTDVRVRQMRSADTRTLAVNRTSSSFGDGTFAAAGTRVWMQSAARPETTGTAIRPVQAVTEDIFIWTVRPRHSVNSLTAPSRNILTYLLTYLRCGRLLQPTLLQVVCSWNCLKLN